MRRVAGMFRKAAAMMFPWPGSDERKAAITAARGEKERSRAGAVTAQRIRGEIAWLAAENHYAQAITDQITARRGGSTGGSR